MRYARGFTLLELLVAITVLSIVSLIAWRGLDSLLRTNERLTPEVDEVRALLTAFGQMERDLAQVVNTALVPLPALAVNVRGGERPGLEIVRLAVTVPNSPSAVQVVFYEVRDGRLIREATAPMNQVGLVARASFTTATLLDDVAKLRVRAWVAGQGWVPAEAANVMPPGLEITVERADGKSYRRVLPVG